MLMHRKSKALFEDTLIGDYYTLHGVNVDGTFRISTDFSEDFDFIPKNKEKEVSREMDKLEWNRSLIYYIGKDRQNQKRKKIELSQARKSTVKFKNVKEVVEIKGSIIRDLDLEFNVERIERFDYERILPLDLNFAKTPKAMEERFSPAQYGKVLAYGVIINTDYLYYQFENGVRVELKKVRPEGMSDEPSKGQKESNDKSIKSKDKKALKMPSGSNRSTSNEVFDMKYLETKLGLPANKLRAALRKHFEKPEGGWKWNSQEEVNKVIAKIKK